MDDFAQLARFGARHRECKVDAERTPLGGYKVSVAPRDPAVVPSTRYCAVMPDLTRALTALTEALELPRGGNEASLVYVEVTLEGWVATRFGRFGARQGTVRAATPRELHDLIVREFALQALAE